MLYWIYRVEPEAQAPKPAPFLFLHMSETSSVRRRRPASRPRTARPSPTASSAQHELTTKRRGELAELAFTLKAASLGFGVSKPYGDSERYDFILDARNIEERHPTRKPTTSPHPCHPEHNPAISPNPCHPERSKPMSKANRLAQSRDLLFLSTTAAPSPNHPPAKIPDTCPALSPRNRRQNPCPLATTPSLWRVQVKCSTQLLNGLYRVNAHRRTHGRAVPYLPTEIHFLVAYIIPEDTWYVIPVQALRGTSLLFRRKKDPRPGLYDKYREAWPLLRPK